MAGQPDDERVRIFEERIAADRACVGGFEGFLWDALQVCGGELLVDCHLEDRRGGSSMY